MCWVLTCPALAAPDAFYGKEAHLSVLLPIVDIYSCVYVLQRCFQNCLYCQAACDELSLAAAYFAAFSLASPPALDSLGDRCWHVLSVYDCTTSHTVAY